jgi:hypothetical protein
MGQVAVLGLLARVEPQVLMEAMVPLGVQVRLEAVVHLVVPAQVEPLEQVEALVPTVHQELQELVE